MLNPTNSTTPFMLCNNPYDFMKSKTQNKVRYTSYANILFNTMLEMFDYNGLPDTIPKRFLETILHTTGEVFVSKINDEIIASHGTLSGEIDAYGLGTNCVAVCPTGSAEGVRNIDIAYGINNDTATPDMLIYWIANLLAETDKSIKLNVIYSRLLKIPKVGNEKDKSTFKELLKKVMDGEPEAFVSSNALDLELGAGAETFELTDANKIDKLPYLTQFFEDCLKRFYCFYGQPMQNQNKRAQSISDEIHGQDSVSMILPLQMLKCRQALCENINNIFGTEISVDFNPLWKIELAGVIERDTNGNMIPDEREVNKNDDNYGNVSGTNGNKKTNGNIETESETHGTGKEAIKTETDDTETDENEIELIEQIENTENAPDIPDMSLEADNPIVGTPETEKGEIEPKSELIELNAVADALGVDAEEIKRLLKGGVDDV